MAVRLTSPGPAPADESAAPPRRGDALALGAALAAHAGLLAWLVLTPSPHAAPPPPERMTVTLSEETALNAAGSPAAAAQAPERGEDPSPPAKPESPVAKAEPAEAPPVPVPVPLPHRAPPRPAAKAAPPLAPRPAPHPQPKPPRRAQPQAMDQLVDAAMERAPRHAAPGHAAPAASTPAKAKPGATRIGADFLKGAPGDKPAGKHAAAGSGPPSAAAIAALGGAIARQLKPHWAAPQGVDAELLVTRVRFSLDRHGMLTGEPQIIGQSGQTEGNAAQVRRHGEQAIRAIKLAQPFILPSDLYPYWQTITSRFDKRLSE